ncbi:hypothetical protein P8C59_008008 [Phyllachora maydis]|uniref:LNS2/PITP domain-containing protein n=1 Tax=Phyllachora maydis TaxID=1825666 RepID=A0AAD9MES3_9PEZI|nr:hypothetical protein P8C59_008008 [Phyllachora maydis]
MQYVRNLSDSVSTAWNSINPATLSGAIDVIVVEHEDGTLACSPFHVRFGKFSLLRPHEKKVEFKVNGAKQIYPMKLGEGGEAFFVFETTDTIPQSLQTSPVVSAASSPTLDNGSSSELQEPESLDLNDAADKSSASSFTRPPLTVLHTPDMAGLVTPRSTSPDLSDHTTPYRPYSDDVLRTTARKRSIDEDHETAMESPKSSERSHSPPPLATTGEGLQRARTLSAKLSAIDIPTRINEVGDLMLDMSAFKNSDEDAFRVEILARKALIEELDGNYDIGALIGLDEQGNIWIYSSEEAKKAAMAAMKRDMMHGLRSTPSLAIDASSDPGYHSDGTEHTTSPIVPTHRRTESDVGQRSLQAPMGSSGAHAGDPNRNYAKTLRLTSDQLKSLNLEPGENSMSFTVNRATCSAYMYLWRHETPVVISDIDGTITKSDALGHVLNMIGRDWTHAGVAKLYSDIIANGYNIMYLTSRSVGQADTTRAYVYGITQDGYKLPRGPCILSPDRTMAALRREIYLRKPHVFKMSTLRDIRNLYGPDQTPFYAGFGNRFTDQISYRTVDVPRNRIFTINSNAEVSLDLLSLNKLKLSYVNMTEVVDHYFPAVSTLVKGGSAEYTDFRYWRDQPLDVDEFSASGSEDEDQGGIDDHESQYAEDEDVEMGEGLGDSYISRGSMDGYGEGSVTLDNEDRTISLAMPEDVDALDEDGVDGDDIKAEVALADAIDQDDGKELGSTDNPLALAVQDLNAGVTRGMKHLSMEHEHP